MRTQQMKLLAPLAALMVATGCLDNSLEITNPNERTVEVFWKTPQDAILATNAVYANLYSRGMYMRNRYWMWARTDATMSRSPASAIQNAIRGVITDYNYGGFLGGLWDDPLEGVYRANQVITRLPEMEIDQALKDRLIAETRFLRGLFFFEQALLFGDVPIILEPVDGTEQPSYTPVNEVYAQTIADAMAAAAVLPWTWSGADIGRATRGAALALAADAHMMRGEWATAATLLQQIVASNAYSLLPGVEGYGRLFTLDGEHSAESLFEVAFGDNNQQSLGVRGNVNPRLVAPSSGAGSSIGFNDVQPTEWAFQQFFAEPDLSYPNNPDPRLQYSIFWNRPGGMDVFGMPFAQRYATTGPGGGGGFRDTDLDHTYFFKKYQEYWKNQLTDFANPINLKIYRYGHVLLMLADALNESGQTQAAEAPLNQLRARVNRPAVPTGMTQAQMREWINREDLLENFWEHNMRLKFLKRHGLMKKEYFAETPAGSAVPRNPFHASLFVNGKSELIPIPQNEMDRNPNAEQNPGW